MQTKLTLRLDDRLISRAKGYANDAGKSLSQVVAEFFAVITSPKHAPFEETPTVSRLRGILKDTDVDDARDYLDYLEEKHL